jgi:hypothetical protein
MKNDKNNYIEMIQSTPKLHSKKCKLIAFIVKVFLQYTTLLSGLIAWYLYDYFIGGAILLLAFVIMGIVRSKLRNSSIPASQREYQYNDKGIADWYVSTHICYDTK